jgi:hypothetical protein
MVELISDENGEITYYNFNTNNYIICTKSSFFPLFNECWPQQTEDQIKNCKRLKRNK